MKLCGICLVAIAFCSSSPSIASGGTVAGLVTSNGSVLAGAVIRTEGVPTCTTTSSSDGSYSITVPAGNYSILVSSTDHVPQRSSLPVIGGASVTQNFDLRGLSSSGSLVQLPAPLDWGEPPAASSAPGDNFPLYFQDMSAGPVAGAPQISGWSEIVKPDESFTLTGSGFTTRTGVDAGTDTTVWIWARTSLSGGVLRQAKVWRVTENTLTATVPGDVPFGMYLVWVENSNGPSSPICLNKTTATWVGPLGNTVQAGNRKRVFGRNISYNHGTATSYVYIQPASGGAMTSCTVNTVNPYMVEFTVPGGTTTGSYKVYVHSGHGGVYGWSDGLDLVVQDDWVRGSDQVNLSPSGTNDTTAIQNAINQMSSLPNGGTVVLAAGVFKTYDQIWVNAKVRLMGAGMNSTTIELRSNTAGRHDYVRVHGDHINIENLTLKACLNSANPPVYGILEGPYPEYPATEANDIKYLNVSLTADQGVVLTHNSLGYSRVEASGCSFFRQFDAGTYDGWVHDSNLYGGPYGLYDPYTFETECAFYVGSRVVFESSHVETQNWPINPVNGGRNYRDFMLPGEYAYKVWAKRVALYSLKPHSYTADLTTKDVAVQDGKGEMILLHSMSSQWFGNPVSSSGLTLYVRTDGTVNGQTVTINNYSSPLTGGQSVPDARPSWFPLDGNWAVVISGKGMGQVRQVVSHTPDSISVDRPWRVEPDSTSVVMVTPEYVDHIIYNNDLNAFPTGYNQSTSASTGVDIDGNGFQVFCERNSSHRTNNGRYICANSGGPTYWCSMRDEDALDCHNGGVRSFWWDANPTGLMLLGNSFRGGRVNITDSAEDGVIGMIGEGTVVENVVASAKMGYKLDGVTTAGGYQDGFTLFRNSSVTVFDGPTSPSVPEPVYVGATDGRQFLVNNAYSGSEAKYFFAPGLSSLAIPVSLYRVARFSGSVGETLRSVMIPVVNAGTAAMSWTVSSNDSWITATIQSNGTLNPESTLGRLVVSVDTTGMPSGRHWGSLTINTSGGVVKVGVCVDLAAGGQSNTAPHAYFTATPSAGTAPLTVDFNAGASVDNDGSVVSYAWDYGDGAYGSGVATSHTYTTANTYTPVLTVTDDSGLTGSAWNNVLAAPELNGVSLSASVVGAVSAGTPVTLTATASGGYQVLYAFLANSGNGWVSLRDYSSSNCFTWTPGASGYYEVKVYARNSVSTTAYDVASSALSYPVGILPSGAKLWLRADAGVTRDGGGRVSSWEDQSGAGNSVGQINGAYRPLCVDNAVNGRSVVRFSGPLQVLQSSSLVLTGDTSFTTFTVGKLSQLLTTGNEYFWWNGSESSNAGYGSYLHSSGYLMNAWGGNAGAPTNSSTALATVGSLYRMCSRFTSNMGTGPNEMWINGTALPNRGKGGSALDGDKLTVGNFGPDPGSGLYGDIAEILIYDRPLTDTERVAVDSYLQLRWAAPAALSVDRLRDVKALGDGVTVTIASPKVAEVASGVYSDGAIYVIEPDRTCGMKILNSGSLNLWDRLNITGVTDTDVITRERVLRASSVTKSSGTEMPALGMANKAFAPSGQFVRVWGRVTSKTTAYFTVDDGSGSPLRVDVGGIAVPISTVPDVGAYVSVTGPAGYVAGGIASVRPRSGSDIQSY